VNLEFKKIMTLEGGFKPKKKWRKWKNKQKNVDGDKMSCDYKISFCRCERNRTQTIPVFLKTESLKIRTL
jgi:hypothetical protein